MSVQRILVIRRENIGDLVCTTPLIRSIRMQLPDARIDALVTRYNAEVLQGSRDLDAVHVYTKLKHRKAGESALMAYASRLRTILELRRASFDWILLPGGPHSSALRFAYLIGSKKLLVRGDEDAIAGPHEVQQTCHLLLRMGLKPDTPAPKVEPRTEELTRIEAQLDRRWPTRRPKLVGIHISARKPSQRWSADNFVRLLQTLHESAEVGFLLLWAPGTAESALHPGDDEKAIAIYEAVKNLQVIGIRTTRLEELVAALKLCSSLICGDGGAMHLAAGLGKPIVCLFGHSDAAKWRPWGVPHRLLQKESRHVDDIAPGEVADAWKELQSAIATD